MFKWTTAGFFFHQILYMVIVMGIGKWFVSNKLLKKHNPKTTYEEMKKWSAADFFNTNLPVVFAARCIVERKHNKSLLSETENEVLENFLPKHVRKSIKEDTEYELWPFEQGREYVQDPQLFPKEPI